MYDECWVRRSGAGAIELVARVSDGMWNVQDDIVLVEAERSLVDVRHLERIVTSDQNWRPIGWCSTCARVVAAGDRVEGIRIGDRIGAVGPAVSHTALPAHSCFLLLDDLEAEWDVWWGLLVALLRSVRKLQIEIGESVLVYGGGLVGNLAAQLSLAAGAGLVVGFDPDRGRRCGDRGMPNTRPGPAWVSDQSCLEEMLDSGSVDVLIDVGDDPSQMGRTLLCLREGGRALSLAAHGWAPTDFDFYPSVHRRSLTLMNGVLGSIPQANGESPTNQMREAAFLAHLIREGGLELGTRETGPVWAVGSGSASWQMGDVDRLIVHWERDEETD